MKKLILNRTNFPLLYSMITSSKNWFVKTDSFLIEPRKGIFHHDRYAEDNATGYVQAVSRAISGIDYQPSHFDKIYFTA